MPELCHETFTSFGGELRARCAMTRHLHEHIDNITQSYQGQLFIIPCKLEIYR